MHAGPVALAGRRAWKTDRALHDADEIHVRPRADVRWHHPHAGCWCEPDTKPLTDGGQHIAWLVTHNAADGRTRPERVDYVSDGPTAGWAGAG